VKTVAIATGVVGVVAVIVVLVLVLTGGDERPEDVAERFAEASVRGDIGEACDLLADNLREERLESYRAGDCRELAEKWRGEFEDDYGENYDDFVSDLDVEIDVEKIDERQRDAEVTLTMTTRYHGDDDVILEDYFGGEKRSAEDWQITLVKQDGRWRVADE